MTMNARVKRYADLADLADLSLDVERQPTGPMKVVGFPDPRAGCIVELVLFHPESKDGRTVLLRLTEQDRDDLMLALRNEAIRARTMP